MKEALEVLEKYLNQYEGDFLATNYLTIADLQIFFEFTDMIPMQRDWSQYPAITAWFNKCMENEIIAGIQKEYMAVLA